jgi:hypothetical protein
MDNYTIVRIFLIVLAVATLIILIQRYNSNQSFVDSEGFYADDDFQRMQDELLPMMSGTTARPSASATTGAPSRPAAATYAPETTGAPRLPTPMPEPTSAPFYSSNGGEDEDYQAVAYSEDGASDAGPKFPEDKASQKNPSECFPKDKLTAEDLLPKDSANSKWSQVNPAGQGSVKDQNFLQAGYHVGLNTTQGTMKNANLQLRSDPVAPKMLVSPWLNSSYEPDVMRKPLEIGEGC